MSSFLLSLSGWDWLDVVGLLMVLVGVVGEIWAARKHNDFWESMWGAVLILGLALEFIALPHHITEAAKLNREAGEARVIAGNANERASTNELHFAELTHSNLLLSAILEGLRSNNLILRSNVSALETQQNETKQIAANAIGLANTNGLNINLNKPKFKNLKKDWFMSEHGSLTNANLGVNELSIGPLSEGWYKAKIIYHVKSFPVDSSDVDNWNRVVSCGFSATRWVKCLGTMTVNENGTEKHFSQNSGQIREGGIEPTESMAEIATHTQELHIWVNQDTILTPTVSRKRPYNADVCLLKDTTTFEITAEEGPPAK